MSDKIFEKLGLGKPKPFRPLAYYDKHMDCIRIELRDCSITEERINEYITLLEDNYPGNSQNRNAGIMIKGVKHLFRELNLPLAGIVRVTSILDEVVKKFPQLIQEEIQRMVAQMELTVNFDEPDLIAA